MRRPGGCEVVSALIARAAIVPVMAEPTLRSEQTSQLVLGETAGVLESSGEWRKVRTRLDGYEGWVHVGYCAEVPDAEADAWRVQAIAWSHGAAVRAGDRRQRPPRRGGVGRGGAAAAPPD